MRICFLGSAQKIHIYRWTTWLAQRGHAVTLMSDHPPSEGFNYGGVKLVRPDWPLLAQIWQFKIRRGQYANNRGKWVAYRRAIENENPEILHAHEALAYGPMLPHFPGYARVLNPWGKDMERLNNPREHREAKRLVRRAAKAADVITTNAPGLESHWADLTGLPKDRFYHFSWGTDLNLFHWQTETEQLDVRRRLGLPRDAPLVLSPRLAKPYYRIQLIMKAWHRARQQDDAPKILRDAKLVILRAGADDQSWRDITTLREKLGEESIIFVDKTLPPEEMSALYSTCEAMVMLPKTDLLASSLIEGMACGCFPILADLPCYRAAIRDVSSPPRPDRAAGIFLSQTTEEAAAEALRRWAAMDPDKREVCKDLNIEYCRHEHDWEKCAEKIFKAYEIARDRFRSRRK